jgi:hypothetical protein
VVLERLHDEARGFLRRPGRRPGLLPCHQQLIVPSIDWILSCHHFENLATGKIKTLPNKSSTNPSELGQYKSNNQARREGGNRGKSSVLSQYQFACAFLDETTCRLSPSGTCKILTHRSPNQQRHGHGDAQLVVTDGKTRTTVTCEVASKLRTSRPRAATAGCAPWRPSSCDACEHRPQRNRYMLFPMAFFFLPLLSSAVPSKSSPGFEYFLLLRGGSGCLCSPAWGRLIGFGIQLPSRGGESKESRCRRG